MRHCCKSLHRSLLHAPTPFHTTYDGEGRRVKKKAYVGGVEVEETVFVYSSGKLIAEYSTAPAPANPTTNYTVTDQLGSPRVIVNAWGEVVSRRDFMPFGEELSPDPSNRTASLDYGSVDSVRQKFTGYQKDEETGLDFAEARMYENRHGRFTAVDPLLASGKSADPQTFNRYVYVLNNPLIFTDPSGLQAGNYTGRVYYQVLEDGRWAFSNKSGKGYDTRYEGGRVRITGIDGYQYTVSATGWRQHGLDVVAASRRAPSPKSRARSLDPINDALLKDLGMRAPAMQKAIIILGASGIMGGLGAAGAVGTGTFGLVVLGEALLAEKTFRDLGQAEHEFNAILGTTRSEAFREAKRGAGIPVTQQPSHVTSVPLVDNGQTVLGEDGKPIMTREYHFKTEKGNLVIQEHSAGHQMGQGGTGDQGPHFNVRPEGDERTGKVRGTSPHYPFEVKNPIRRR